MMAAPLSDASRAFTPGFGTGVVVKSGFRLG